MFILTEGFATISVLDVFGLFRADRRNFLGCDANKRVETLLEIFPHQVVDEKVCERANAEDRRGDEGKSIDTRIAPVGVSVQDSRKDGGDERNEENNLNSNRSKRRLPALLQALLLVLDICMPSDVALARSQREFFARISDENNQVDSERKS